MPNREEPVIFSTDLPAIRELLQEIFLLAYSLSHPDDRMPVLLFR
ncbi:MAG: hypothetical protein METHP_00693 [Methanoregula sp. SKADARSKE-2]|nr:MAG: hypothetical protein METHP_00693 [Methanoregula sp. SKADARSKE-2]